MTGFLSQLSVNILAIDGVDDEYNEFQVTLFIRFIR